MQPAFLFWNSHNPECVFRKVLFLPDVLFFKLAVGWHCPRLPVDYPIHLAFIRRKCNAVLWQVELKSITPKAGAKTNTKKPFFSTTQHTGQHFGNEMMVGIWKPKLKLLSRPSKAIRIKNIVVWILRIANE